MRTNGNSIIGLEERVAALRGFLDEAQGQLLAAQSSLAWSDHYREIYESHIALVEQQTAEALAESTEAPAQTDLGHPA